MRVRHCSVRVIVRQPWLLEDTQRVSVALTRLVSDVLAARLSTRLDRVGAPARLGTVAMRVALPAPVVLALADGAPSGPEGGRLPSFGAEVAVHDAASGALHAAFEQAVLEPLGGPQDPHGRSWVGPDDRPGGSDLGAGPAGGRADPAARPPEPAAEPAAAMAAAASRAAGRLAAAVGSVLLAAVRLGRLPQLLRRSDPTLAAEWVRLLASDAGWPVAPAAAPGAPPAPPAGVSLGPIATVPGAPGAPPAGGDPPEGQWPGPAAPGGPPTTAEVEATAQAVLAALEGAAGGASIRLAAAASVAARLQLSPSDPRVWRALERRLGPLAAEPPEAPVAGPTVAAPAFLDRGRRHPSARRELEVASVLPFLLVGPLDDLGVLDAISAALAGPGWSDLLVAFAAGLARKALPPPSDRWRQPVEVAATVAAFTGQDHLPDGAASERLGRAVARWWPVVEEALTAELVDLRTPGAPLVVTRSPGGLVAAGADGLAPLLWDGDSGGVRRLWERCARPLVLADPSLAGPLAGLGPSDDPAQVGPLSELVALASERPAGGRAGLAPALDGPIGLVAGVALAALAWELWQRHGERTHPAMAARRLADLDGRVTLGPDRVTVRMPLGRRHADLRDSGLLRTVAAVPWLDGRSLELQGG